MENDEVTILTGWAEAVIEALAHTPEYIESLLANANFGAPWRDGRHITKSPNPLREAIGFLERVVRDITQRKADPQRVASMVQRRSSEGPD